MLTGKVARLLTSLVLLLVANSPTSSEVAGSEISWAKDKHTKLNVNEVRVVENVQRKSVDPMQVVEVFQGEVALLPCNINPSSKEDRVKLVLWFRNESLQPFYTYDRITSPQQPQHWENPDEPTYNRTFFSTNHFPASMVLKNTRVQDISEYRCRVDFEQQPTSIQTISLKVIVPPEKPVIFDETLGTNVNGKYVGPYREGQNLSLVCTVIGGDPEPTVSWQRDGHPIESLVTRIPGQDRTKAKLTLQNLTRADLHSRLTCLAGNSNRSQPSYTSVRLDMTFPALKVRIVRPSRPLIQGNREVVKCEVIGSKPPPRIEWYLGTKKLPTYKIKTSADENVTVSSVELDLQSVEAMTSLTCRAITNNIMEVKEDVWNLDIQFKPEVRIRLGGSLNQSNIRQGDDLYFECDVKANPEVKVFKWRHNGVLIEDPGPGMILTTNSLVIQKVQRSRQGEYSCIAENSLGRTESSNINLNIKYAPVCARDQQKAYKTVAGQPSTVRCRVEANPTHDLKFFWKFNNTLQNVDIQSSEKNQKPGESLAILTPQSELEYGTVSCWAVNSVGEQTTPCTFHLVPGGPPQHPRACAIHNLTYSGFRVDCEDDRQGSYYMVIVEANTGVEIATLKSTSPQFDVRDLTPGRAYTCRLYLETSRREQSDPFYLQTTTLKEPEKVLAETRVRDEDGTSPILGIVIGTALTILIVIAILLVVIFCSKQVRRHRRDNNGNPDVVASVDRSSHYAASNEGEYMSDKKARKDKGSKDKTYISSRKNCEELNYAELCLETPIGSDISGAPSLPRQDNGILYAKIRGGSLAVSSQYGPAGSSGAPVTSARSAALHASHGDLNPLRRPVLGGTRNNNCAAAQGDGEEGDDGEVQPLNSSSNSSGQSPLTVTPPPPFNSLRSSSAIKLGGGGLNNNNSGGLRPRSQLIVLTHNNTHDGSSHHLHRADTNGGGDFVGQQPAPSIEFFREAGGDRRSAADACTLAAVNRNSFVSFEPPAETDRRRSGGRGSVSGRSPVNSNGHFTLPRMVGQSIDGGNRNLGFETRTLSPPLSALNRESKI